MSWWDNFLLMYWWGFPKASYKPSISFKKMCWQKLKNSVVPPKVDTCESCFEARNSEKVNIV